MSELKENLRKCVFGSVMGIPPADWPADDADLFELGLDSMTIMRILVEIEEKLAVKLSERDLDPSRVQSLDALTQWVEVTKSNC